VLVVGFPAAVFATNCWVLAAGPGQRCIIVDPGVGVVPQLEETLAAHRLTPAAVVLTHGHGDHTYSVTPVCGAHDVPAWIHPDDAERLADPWATSDPRVLAAFGSLEWTEPDDVRLLSDGAVVSVDGLSLTVSHAPGHTAGSVLFALPADEDGPPRLLSGDVLFAGSVGRTDLAGGDPVAMAASLARRVWPLAPETVVLPGHGPITTIGAEQAGNPYLRAAAGAVQG